MAHYVFGEGATTLAEAQHNFAPITYTGADNGTYFDKFGVLQTSAADTARFDHIPVSGVPLGLSGEGEREELCLQTEDFNTTWTLVNHTITINDAVAPDGNTTADLIARSSTVAGCFEQQALTTTSGQPYVASVFLSADSATLYGLRIQNAYPDRVDAVFDLSDGTINSSAASTLTGLNSGIEDIGGGIYFCWITGVVNDTTTTFVHGPTHSSLTLPGGWEGTLVTTPNAAHGWGANFSLGTFPLSYAKATTGTVTRTADIPTTALSSISGFDATNHSGLFEGRTARGGGTQTLMSMDDGTANERIYIERNSSDEIHLVVVDGGVAQADLNLGTVADDTELKVSYRVAASDFAGSLDGASVVTDTGGTMPTVTTLRWGHNYTSADHWNRTISDGVLWNNVIPDAQLQALSR